jgi:hypothetical protein
MSYKKSPEYYENCKVLAPDGTILFRTNKNKIQHYLENEFAREVSTNPLTIQLNFIPRGNNHAGDSYLIDEKINHCVCCGAKEKLTSHHIVPRAYTRHFPPKIKKLTSAYDNMLLCTRDHGAYEREAQQLSRQLEKEAGLSPFSIPERTINAARTLVRYGHLIPSDKKEHILQPLRVHYGRTEISGEDIQEIATLDFRSVIDTRRKTVINASGDLQVFIVRWRKHFVETMHPRFLPSSWNIHCPLEKLLRL